MLASMLALAQSGPRFDGDVVNVVLGILVLGTLALVFWASRPSAAARYQTPPEQADAPASAETEPRA